ncbi:hypothetical protein Dimus_034807 [Dionaea muscipula]
MKVDIISSERIKPSTPTPQHLRAYKFSFLDQLSPVLYAPFVLFYANKLDGSPLLQPARLRESLRETLAKFYPLAGRIKDNFTIDCNDEGILFMEAQADCAMLDFLKPQPCIDLLRHFLPPKKTLVLEPITEVIQVSIQVTRFQCGGIAIGWYCFHKIIDGHSAHTFLNSWAASTRGDAAGANISPDFNTAPSLFPAKDLLSSHLSYVRMDPGTAVVLKRFVFDASALQTLKERVVLKSSDHRHSRVEALSSFIWKHAVLASNDQANSKQPSLFVHSVNMRYRSIPPLPEGSMGNLYSLAPARCERIEKEDELHVLAGKVREAISKVNDESVKALQTEEGFMKNYKAMANNPIFKNANKYWCTSLGRLGFTEVDFGMGKPIWVCPPFDTQTSLHKNQIFLIGYADDGRIEAWMVLDQREMEILENDEEFLAFASPNKELDLFAPSCVMMVVNMKVDVISSETIKPSTPTPLHLTSYKFSFLDQLSPVLYVPLILFYPNHPEKDGSAPSLLPRLKETLSETLTKFYPLAGRIKDNFTIDCNDKGILYSEAQADCAMLDFLKEPGIELLGHFLPCKTTSTCVEQPITEFIQVMIQVTSFQCGGLALGVSYFHKILDGASANTFLNSWAALARGRDGEAISPDFNTAPRLFPAKDLLSSHSSYVRVQPGVVVVLKRFVFDASAIRTLKGKAKSEHMSNPSSVEALSGFIWKHLMLASNEVNSGDERASLFVHSVNMRNRSIPPLPEGSMGNLYSLAPAASYDQIEKEEDPHALASKVREAISKVNDESVKALQTEEGFMKTYRACLVHG